MASTGKQTAYVRLEVMNETDSGESHTYRYLTLEAPSYSVRIGRGSRSGSKDLYPANNNAWFDSRVMSREHAVLKAHPGSKTLTIEDVGSMHGTYVDDVKLSKLQPKFVHDGATIIFGAEVSRGPGKRLDQWRLDLSPLIVLTDMEEIFPALEIDVFYSFKNDENMQGDMTAAHGACTSERAASHLSRNSFSVPEYDSDEEYESEMEVKIVPPPRAAAIPESDVSNGGSFVSDDDRAPHEPWNGAFYNTFHTLDGKSQSNKHTKTSLADVILAKSKEGSNGHEDVAQSQLVTNNNASRTPRQTSPQSAARSTAVMVEDSANFTDEQSESNYADDISAGLFDEDFDTDGFQRTDRQPDVSSFSSQSPILTSLPSKVELTAYHSTAKVPMKPILPQSHLPATSAPRAPSPSDAAMPKVNRMDPWPHPSRYQPNVIGSASMDPLSHDQGYYPYRPVSSQDTSYMRSYGYTPSQDVHGVQDTYPQPYYPLDVYSQYYEAPALDWSWGGAQPQVPSKSPVTALKMLEPEPAPVPAPSSSFVTIKTTPRVAIKDLVDEPENAQEPSQKRRGKSYTEPSTNFLRVSEQLGYGLKRKVDQISEADEPDLLPISEVAMEASLPEDQQDAQIVKTFSSTTNSLSQTDLWEPVGINDKVLPAAIVADVQHKTVDERPKKKARRNFSKYAAATASGIAIGAAIGAVGAVAALVALPPDFFV